METKEQFYKDIKKQFPSHKKEEKKYLLNLKSQIEEYDHCTYDELEEIFGRPQDIVESYYKSLDHPYPSKNGKGNIILKMICIVIAVGAVAFSAWKGYQYYLEEKVIREETPDTVEIGPPIEIIIGEEEINGEPQLR